MSEDKSANITSKEIPDTTELFGVKNKTITQSYEGAPEWKKVSTCA